MRRKIPILLVLAATLFSFAAYANNNVVTLFLPLLRAASGTAYVTPDLYNYSWRGIQVNLKVTARGSNLMTLDCKLQGKDMVTSAYYDLPLAVFAQQTAAAATPTPLTLYPGVVSVTNVNANGVLPLVYRFSCLVGGTNATFSAAGQLEQ